MPKHSLKNGILIAESIVKFKENFRGLTQSCAVLAVNVSNNDVNLSANALLGSLIKNDADDVLSESFLCNAEDSIRSEHNLTTNDVAGLMPLSKICSSDICGESTTNKSFQHRNKIKVDLLRANKVNVQGDGMSLNDNGFIDDCGTKADSASHPSGDSENHKNNRRKLRIEDINIENKDFAEDLLKMLNEFRVL